jgi:UMF1 family MFS transporter
MNAYLPMLAREDAKVRDAWQELKAAEIRACVPGEGDAEESEEREEATAPLLASQVQPTMPSPSSNLGSVTSYHQTSSIPSLRSAYTSILSVTTSRISSTGIALGYASGIVLLFVALVPVTMMHGSTFALRLAIGMSGLWWAVGSVPSWLWLPGSNEEVEEGGDAAGAGNKWGGQEEWKLRREVWKAWKRLGRMLRWREIQRLRNTFWYLAAWFLLSDGARFLMKFTH